MNVGRYRLLAQAGAGCDSVVYRAQADDEPPVELRVLSVAKADAERWPWLVRRLRLVTLLDHPASIPILEAALDHDPPYLVTEWNEAEPSDTTLASRVPLPVVDAIDSVRTLAGLLAAAHKLGLVHGHVGPTAIRLGPANQPRLDFTTDGGSTLDGAASGVDTAMIVPDAAVDIHGLGVVLYWLLTGREPATPLVESVASLFACPSLTEAAADQLGALLKAMFSADPLDRPTAQQVEQALPELAISAGTVMYNARPAVPTGVQLEMGTRAAPGESGPLMRAPASEGEEEPLLKRGRLGRYRLLQKLGQGGMGAVYRGEDPVDGSMVAIKVMRPDLAAKPEALRRFHKEARLLAEVNNPNVANLLEVNEEEGTHFLVLEFVAGINLGDRLKQQGRLAEAEALAIAADIARGLAAAHEHRIVHRDIKPDNVLLAQSAKPKAMCEVKLTDFGLARHVVESESLDLTQPGTLLGTPHYMAPEQFAGSRVDARADVYALGATLFHMLAGRPPFVADNLLAIASMHRNDPLPSLQQFNPDISEATCRLVERTLGKTPEARPAHAGALLAELERLLRGEPSEIAVHPRLPECDPRRVLTYDWTWDLNASPRQLWPHVSNTERLNRAIGLPAVEFSTRTDDEGVKRFGKVSKMGLAMAYREHPFEWVEGRRMGVLREFSQGPFRWAMSVTELEPRSGGGTKLHHQIRVEPHGILGRTAAALEIGRKARNNLDRVYRRIDAAMRGELGNPALIDAFEEPAVLSAARRRRLETLLDRLVAEGIDPTVAERIGEFLESAPAQEVSRIRPLALARRLGLPPELVVAACLRGARAGLFVLLWDLLCPVCRIASEITDTLKALKDHGHCEACNLDYALDFARSVEMIFRIHPDIRDADTGTYCIGGPAHHPHVIAQVRLAPGERVELEMALGEGAYRLRGPQLPYAIDFRVQPGAPIGRWDVVLGSSTVPAGPRIMRPGSQVIALKNEHTAELVARLERTIARDDALTAARAASLALFRELFPGEVLSAGNLVSVATVTLLVTDLELPSDMYAKLGDAPAFGIIHEHFRLLDERIRKAGGALVKTVGEGVLAVFEDPLTAVETALDLQAVLAAGETTRALRLKAAVHRGPAMAATLNDHLDYFGATVREAMLLPPLIHGGEVVLSASVASDTRVAALLMERRMTGDLLDAAAAGKGVGPLLRLTTGD